MAMSSSELKDAAQGRGATLRLETLASLVRHAHGHGQDAVGLLEAAARHLLKRSRPIARSVSHRATRTSEDWEDGRQYAFHAMLRDFAAQEDDDGLTFWEINFAHIFKRRCIDGIIGQRRKVDRTAASVDQLSEEGVEFEFEPADPLDRLMQREILSILSPEEAVAARLRWFDRFPMNGEGSVPELMDVSRKTVYKYLTRAKAKVRADPRFDAWAGRR